MYDCNLPVLVIYGTRGNPLQKLAHRRTRPLHLSPRYDAINRIVMHLVVHPDGIFALAGPRVYEDEKTIHLFTRHPRVFHSLIFFRYD